MNKLAKLRLQGPLNILLQHQVIKILNRLSNRKVGGLAILINSFGGSLRSAKNISDRIKKYRNETKVPVFCFAEDYCLNSANLILTVGTKCYAHRLSTIGDFGYVYEEFSDEEIRNSYGVGKQSLSNTDVKVKEMLTKIQLKDRKTIENLTKNEEKQLKEEVIKNRKTSINILNNSVDQFDQNILSIGTVQPFKAVSHGLIDEISDVQHFIDDHKFPKKPIELNEKMFCSPIYNSLMALQDYLRGIRNYK